VHRRHDLPASYRGEVVVDRLDEQGRDCVFEDGIVGAVVKGPQVQAAVTVADSDGLAAVTMRRVAAAMGTGSASLYRHVATRDELIDLMVNDAFEAYETAPARGRWRADLVAEELHQLRYLRSRPWLLDAVLTRPPIGSAVLRLSSTAWGSWQPTRPRVRPRWRRSAS